MGFSLNPKHIEDKLAIFCLCCSMSLVYLVSNIIPSRTMPSFFLTYISYIYPVMVSNVELHQVKDLGKLCTPCLKKQDFRLPQWVSSAKKFVLSLVIHQFAYYFENQALCLTDSFFPFVPSVWLKQVPAFQMVLCLVRHGNFITMSGLCKFLNGTI